MTELPSAPRFGEGADGVTPFGRRQAPPRLPTAWTSRFSPVRAGILNLWQYDEQELRFEQGRLLLRGDNGAGKSKALELLLPFLLDADLSPQRLDPFAGTARTMYWNLLPGDRHESRVGYVWLELGRQAGDGETEEEYLTLGCGLRATRRTQRVDAWYFVSRRRIGDGLALLSPQRVPLLKDELRKALGAGDGGEIFDTGREYRERIDHLLFNLGEERFAALRHLLLQLRRPQLSQKLDSRSLGDLLTESLPPVDAALIDQLSDSFERLDQGQRELAQVEAAARELEGFLTLYRDYSRGAARARAAEVRKADSSYHKTAAEVRDAEAEHERWTRQEMELIERRHGLERETDVAQAQLRALEASPAMRSAEVLRARHERAADLERHAAAAAAEQGKAGQAAAAARGAMERAEAEARQAEEERDGQALAAVSLAAEAGLETIHAAASQSLLRNPAAAEPMVRSALERRRKAVEEVRGLAGLRDRAREGHARAEDRRAEADARWRQAAERTLAERKSAERIRDALDAALSAWRNGLSHLLLDDPGFAAVREAALDSPDAAAVLTRIADPQIDRSLREIRDAEAASGRLSDERRSVTEERDRVAAARELGPEPPRTRAADDRPSRPGAPLYLLCDFADALGEEERAGLEAALEAAGLLDAWVTPDGRLLAPGTLDTVLVPSPPSPGSASGTLAGLLVAAPGHGVERDAIEAVLQALDGSGEGSDHVHRVGLDGSWRLGPLHGTWAKSAAEHVGAAAREAARLRRLAELGLRLEELDRELAASEARYRTLTTHLDELRREAAALPSSEPLRTARLAVEAAAGEEERRRAELAAAEGSAAEARRALDEAERRLARRARELDLAGRLGDLPAYLLLLERYAGAFGNLTRAWRAAAGAVARRETAALSLAAAEERSEQAQRESAEAGSAAARARAEVETLEATVGEEARRILEQHGATVRRLEAFKQERQLLDEEREEAARQRVRAETLAQLHRRDLAERDAARQAGVEGLRALAGAGLLDLVLDPAADGPAAVPAAEWLLTHALDLARAIERSTADVDLAEDAATRRANRLYERFQRLITDLGADYQPSLGLDGDLIRVRILYNGNEETPGRLLALLREAAEARRGLLADQERDTLRSFLLGEVGDHLRRRLRQAMELVREMNDQLTRCATASGMVLRLDWRPDSEADDDIRAVVDLLRRDPHLLPEDGRLRLAGFFQRQIEAARSQWVAVPWRQHLMQALDYRRWHRFQIQRRLGEEGAWQELTRHGHAAISGGEKAVALHLPLFAAASAHYRSARETAPRIILLDEAFAGIDQRMRGRCMGLLTEFDLDFMITSYDEWGCYEELPGLSIYQLYRDPAFDGIAAVRFLWNGRHLREVQGEEP